MSCEVWPVRFPCDISEYDADLVTAAVDASQSILWAMTGRRFGICETTESYRMPCTSQCYTPWQDNFGPGVDYQLGNDNRRKCCAIALESRPVKAIMEVKLNGDVLDPDEYYLGRGTLYRIGQCWPCDEECDLPPIEVTYKYGIDVPVLGELAMGELACELLAGWDGMDCRLPSNAVSVTRQGVTVDLSSPETLFAQNRIGLPISDQFIYTSNPDRLRSRSTIHSPDIARRVR
jgi:hypothetical protein